MARKKKNDSAPLNEESLIPIESVANDGAETKNGCTENNESNSLIRQIFDQNFLEYASYVIKDRAIPDVDDGLKPVQRRILWSMYRMDDGRLNKAANIIGHTMQFHPHGDQSIGDALVVLANKELYVDHQGNFGNILTGDGAAAPRYIEARLSHLGREVLFNNPITTFIDSYDGRNKEPIRLPVKIPSLLILGSEGIAVTMATNIPPHNFCEVIEAQIALLKNEPFVLYPDFPQGGLMDVSEYDKGEGKVQLRARIERDGRNLIIREIPFGTTTESLITSIESAAENDKIKIQEIRDHTTKDVNIEIHLMRGYDPEKALNALYAYTKCQLNFVSKILVIKDNLPEVMTVDKILLRNTERLLFYLRAELEIELNELSEKLHARTLERIFIEERIYKRIEECKSKEAVSTAIYTGLDAFKKELIRKVNDEDIERLLAIPIRRISLFDISKNLQEIEGLHGQIATVLEHLKKLNAHAINYLKDLLKKYGHLYPRKTEIVQFEKIDLKAAALSNVKVGWDRKGGYLGSNVKSDESITCTEYDRLLCVERSGDYQVIRIPDKKFVDKLYDMRKYEPEAGFCMVYTDKKTNRAYWKRFKITRAMTDKDYQLCPKGARIELLTTRLNATFQITLEGRTDNVMDLNLWEAPERSARSRGLLIDNKKMKSLKLKELVDGVDVIFGNPSEEVEDADVAQEYNPEEMESATHGWTFTRSQTAAMRDIITAAKDEAEAYEQCGIIPPPNLPKDEVAETLSVPTDIVTDEVDAEPLVSEQIPAGEVIAATETVAPAPPDDAFDLSASPEVKPKKKKVAGTKVSPAAKEAKDKKEDSPDEDDWGMVQMDLGF